METKPHQFDIAVDCDDVLVNIAEPWIHAILCDPAIAALLPEEAQENAKLHHPMNRLQFDILSHFHRDTSKISPADQLLMHNKYFMSETFYDELEPSSYYFMLKSMMEFGVLKSVSVVTSCIDLSYPVTKSKVRFLLKIFESFKTAGVEVRFILTEKGQTKAQAINEHKVVYSTFVDDSIANIVDVIMNTNSDCREFMIPRYRFNTTIPDEKRMTDEKQIKVFWFDNDCKLLEHTDRLCNPKARFSLPDGQVLDWHK